MERVRLGGVGLAVLLVVSAVFVGFLAGPARAVASYPKPLAVVTGIASGEGFGRSVAIADLNGDGVADLVVGAPFNSVPGRGTVGSVFIYLSGPNGKGGLAPFQSVVQINGTSPYDLFGWSVAAIGDVNGDGIPDLAVGAPLAPAMVSGSLKSSVGNVTIFFGAPNFNARSSNRTLSGFGASDEFGYSLAPAGDVNLDGLADFVVGAPYSSPGGLLGAGSAYVFEGVKAPGTISNTPSFTFTGTQGGGTNGISGGGHMGWSVAGGVNVDKNTLLDMVAGAPNQGPAGAAYIIRNIAATGPGPSIDVVNGKNSGDEFGDSVTMLAGMTGNGFGDVAIGAPLNADGGTKAGEVSVIFGGSKFSTTIDLTLAGQPGEEFGSSLAAGDVREDGFTDLLVGAPTSSLNVSSAGRAYVFYGSTSPGTSANLTLVPYASDGAGLFGSSITTGSNFTAGHDYDYAVGAPQATISSILNVGDAYAYNGTKVVVPEAPTVAGFVCVPNTLVGGTCTGIANFAVSLQNPGLTKTGLTPTNGAFNFGSVPAGTYYLNATKGGYIANTTTVSLALNTNYVFYFFPQTLPLVTGTIRDAVNRSFVNGVTIAMYNGTTLVNSTVTGPSGNYRIYLPVPLVPAAGTTTNVTLSAFDATHYTNTTGKLALVRNGTASASMFLNRFPFVSGTVRSAANAAAIKGATVQVTQGTAVLATATTNNQGAYSLWATNATVPAPVFLNFTAPGFFRNTTKLGVNQNLSYTVSPFLPIDNVPPTSSLNVLPTYTNSAVFTVSGTDSDPNGNGVAQVQLWYKFNRTGSFVLYGSISNPATTFSFSFNSTAAKGDGNYQFYSIAIDYASLVQATPSGNMTWTIVDTVPPTSHVNALPTFETVANFTAMATASDLNGVASVGLYYRIGTSGAYTLLSKDLTAPYSWWVNTTALGTGDGLYQFYSIATDNAGNVENAPSSPDTQTTVDTTPPAVAITSPSAGAVLGTGWVNVTWTASDATSGIAEFDLRLDTGAWVHAGTNLYYNFTFVADGTHTVAVNATDLAGNSKTVTVSFAVSTVTPFVAITSPAASAYMASSSLVVTWTVTNTGAGLAAINVRLDAGSWRALGASVTTYTFSGVADGSHTIAVQAVGLNGAQDTATATVTVDTTPPTVTITSPATNAWTTSSSVVVSFTASDATSGVLKVTLSIDGGTAVDVTGLSTYTASGLADGSHTVAVTGTDRAGNTATATVIVKVDATPPTVTISSPTAGASVASGNVTVMWTATDSGSGVAKVELSVDNGSFQTVTGGSTVLTGLAAGSHTVVVRATDVAGNVKTATVTFAIAAPSGGSLNALAVAGAVAVVVVVIAVVAFLYSRRRKGKGPAEPPAPPPPEPPQGGGT